MPLTTISNTGYGMTSYTGVSLVGDGSQASTLPAITFSIADNNANPTNRTASLQAEDNSGNYVCDLVFYTRFGSYNDYDWVGGSRSTAYERLRIKSGVNASGTTVIITGICRATTGFNVSSSLKYKKNITDFPNEYNLDMLMKYRAVVYNQKEDEKNKFLPGFIAEELDKIGAKLFVTYKDGEPEALDYSRIYLHLVKVIQEMKKEYDKKIDKMQKTLDELEKKI
jgi:hypothetical protein